MLSAHKNSKCHANFKSIEKFLKNAPEKSYKQNKFAEQE
jgi:hypothetical protein